MKAATEDDRMAELEVNHSASGAPAQGGFRERAPAAARVGRRPRRSI